MAGQVAANLAGYGTAAAMNAFGKFDRYLRAKITYSKRFKLEVVLTLGRNVDCQKLVSRWADITSTPLNKKMVGPHNSKLLWFQKSCLVFI